MVRSWQQRRGWWVLPLLVGVALPLCALLGLLSLSPLPVGATSLLVRRGEVKVPSVLSVGGVDVGAVLVSLQASVQSLNSTVAQQSTIIQAQAKQIVQAQADVIDLQARLQATEQLMPATSGADTTPLVRTVLALRTANASVSNSLAALQQQDTTLANTFDTKIGAVNASVTQLSVSIQAQYLQLDQQISANMSTLVQQQIIISSNAQTSVLQQEIASLNASLVASVYSLQLADVSLSQSFTTQLQVVNTSLDTRITNTLSIEQQWVTSSVTQQISSVTQQMSSVVQQVSTLNASTTSALSLISIVQNNTAYSVQQMAEHFAVYENTTNVQLTQISNTVSSVGMQVTALNASTTNDYLSLLTVAAAGGTNTTLLLTLQQRSDAQYTTLQQQMSVTLQQQVANASIVLSSQVSALQANNSALALRVSNIEQMAANTSPMVVSLTNALNYAGSSALVTKLTSVDARVALVETLGSSDGTATPPLLVSTVKAMRDVTNAPSSNLYAAISTLNSRLTAAETLSAYAPVTSVPLSGPGTGTYTTLASTLNTVASMQSGTALTNAVLSMRSLATSDTSQLVIAVNGMKDVTTGADGSTTPLVSMLTDVLSVDGSSTLGLFRLL